jgi:glutaredoxin
MAIVIFNAKEHKRSLITENVEFQQIVLSTKSHNTSPINIKDLTENINLPQLFEFAKNNKQDVAIEIKR